MYPKMKIESLLFLILFIVVGCSNPKKTSDQIVDKKNEVSLRLYWGEWVNTKYLRSVRTTKSAKASQYAGCFSSIIIINLVI